MAKSIQPVSPAEVKSLEFLTGKDLSFKSIWRGKVSYFINGKGMMIKSRLNVEANDRKSRDEFMETFFGQVFFDQEMKRFARANKGEARQKEVPKCES